MVQLSVVTTVYNSCAFLEEFTARMIRAVSTEGMTFEIIFVNDGSPDSSLSLLRKLQEQHPQIVIVDLARNVGHHRAIMTGLQEAQGEYVFLIDCDLEEDPELFSLFLREMRSKTDIDVIVGVQQNRKGGPVERMSGAIFYAVFNTLSDVKIPRNILTVRLMTQRYVKALRQFKEKELALGALMVLAGFGQVTISVIKHERRDSSYTFSKRFGLMLNFITSFSNKPLIFLSYFGIMMTLISIGISLFLIIQKIVYDVIVPGWTSILVSTWFVGGVTVFSIGIVGLYVSKIFMETKNRPISIIKDIYRSHKGI